MKVNPGPSSQSCWLLGLFSRQREGIFAGITWGYYQTKRSHRNPAIQSLILCRTAWQWKPQIKQMHQPNAMHTNVPVFLCKVWSDKEKHFLKVPFYEIKQTSNDLTKYRGTLTFEPQEFCLPSCFSPLWILHLNNRNFLKSLFLLSPWCNATVAQE